MRVLIVDDDNLARRTVARIVARLARVEIEEAASLEKAEELLEQQPFDVALLDLRLSRDSDNRDGLSLIKLARDHWVLPIVVSGFHEMADVRAAMRRGAYDYILKEDLSEELILPLLEGLRSQRSLEQEVMELRARRSDAADHGMIGTSPAMQHLRDMLRRVAVSERPVLVTGPTGAGKELVVRAIHTLGPRPQSPLIDLNCGALPANLIEGQLFGYERGAFTGAERRHEGYFSAVQDGTIFLDEIGELPIDLQAKLLRVLESGGYRSLGSTTVRQFRGRVVAATHVDLEARIEDGRFREDLFYRLNVLELRVPSLEERRSDIPALVAHFIGMQVRPLVVTAEAMAVLESMRWPGNVRQLRNLVDRLTVFAPQSTITPETLVRFVSEKRDKSADIVAQLAAEVLKRDEPDKLQFVEALLIDEALRRTDGNRSAAARLLGVHRKVVERRLERFAPQASTASSASPLD